MAQYTMDTEGVAGLEQQYNRQAESVNTARTTVAGIITQVGGLLAEAIATEGPLNAALDVLVADANNTVNVAEGVNWTGPSSDKFRATTAEMTQSITAIRESLGAAYDEFGAAARNLNVQLEDVGQRFDATCTECEAVTLENMTALGGHRADTDALFQGGLA